MAYLWIGLGSALGGMGRYWLSGLVDQKAGETFPLGTLAVNVTGSLLIGALAAMAEPDGRFGLAPAARQFLMIGVLGGYTTFSSFSLQTLGLMQEGEWFYAASNALLSVLLCLGAVWIGYGAGQFLNEP